MILLVVMKPEKAGALVRWGLRVARGAGEPLEILAVDSGNENLEPQPFDERRDGENPLVTAMLPIIAEEQGDLDVSLQVMSHPRRESGILNVTAKRVPSLLIIGKHGRPAAGDREAIIARECFEKAACATMLVRIGEGDLGTSCGRIVVPTAGGRHSRLALKLGLQMAKATGGVMVPTFVEPNTDEVSSEVGEHTLSRILKREGIDREAVYVEPKVVLANDTEEGIQKVVKEGAGLLLLGASEVGSLRRKLFGTLPEHMLQEGGSTAIAVVRRPRPVKEVVKEKVERFLHLRFPQLRRSDRIALFEHMQLHGRWSFDFMMLMCLATAIAALGLIQNSAAVTIGAMLVAPLMTPLLGAGLALVQANRPMIWACSRAILNGFLCALAIGFLVGGTVRVFFGSPELTSELLARGKPSLLDMGVAFFSGLAASYCVARPKLSGALAGVAIAAALVPPLATIGISLAYGEMANADGAAKLFGTNVVCIVIGAAVHFYLAGIRGVRGKGAWTSRLWLVLLACAAMLAVPLASVLVSVLSSGKDQVAESTVEALDVRLKAVRGSDARVLSAVHQQEFIDVRISDDSPADEKLIDAFSKVLEDKGAGKVRIRTELVVE